MIQVLLLILKIIGITILSLLGFLLIAVLLVLFVPIFYQIRIIHNPEQTKVRAKISFLFPLFLVTVQYLNQLSYRLRICGIAVLNSEKPKKDRAPKKVKKKKKKEKHKRTEQEEEEPFFAPLNPPASVQTDDSENASDSIPHKKPEEAGKRTESRAENKKIGLFSKIKAKFIKIRETILKIISRIKRLLHQKDAVKNLLAKQETKSVLLFAWDKLKRLLKHIFPRKIKGYVAYGADNPATTGQVLGILSIVYARTGMLLELRPNFTEKQMECDILLKGRLQVVTLLIIAFKVIFNKELRKVINGLKKIKEIE